MYFQTIDTKQECNLIYDGKSLTDYDDSLVGDRTWSHSCFLEKDVEYAYLYAKSGISQAAPEHLQMALKESHNRLRAFYISLSEAKIDLNRHCFFNLVPDSFITEHCELKNKVCKYVFDTIEKPSDYEFLSDLHKLTTELSTNRLRLDFSEVIRKSASMSEIERIRRVSKSAPYIKYNIFGSKTGRLTTYSNSFPILNLKKEYRSGLMPTKDYFVELDFNAFELRILLYLLGKEQPEIDIQEWNAKNLYNGAISREDSKKRIFSWLFNLESSDQLSEAGYQRDEIIKKYWDGDSVTNPFGRKINCDKFHATSYLIQSTAADIVLRQLTKVHKFLKGYDSKIAFSIHDSVVLDVKKEELGLIREIRDMFSSFGGVKFKTGVSVGETFGGMRGVG